MSEQLLHGEDSREARAFACCGGVLLHTLECRGRPEQAPARQIGPNRLARHKPKAIADKIEHRRKIEANNKASANLSFSDLE
jgi:hypothetical protein